ncbi:MAG: RecQ family ATP-dependent DNA helicase [Alistipes sp.]|nr:RecQ family ATP-dependent DNA helicase [Alistipes sp.]
MKLNEPIHDVLKRYWGYNSFRSVQEEAIRSITQDRDTLVLMPTGGGKSLVYQVPAMASDGLCIVVTPLIALMKDQVDNLRAKGIQAVAVHSGLSPRQIDILLDNCVYGTVKFLYVAPERLSTEVFRLRVQRMNISLIAVDEAHCISQWGYDFRPSYLRIAEIRKLIPDVPLLALTASATPFVTDDIMKHLLFAEKNVIRADFARKNLIYSVRKTEDKDAVIFRLLNGVQGSGIIYVRTREGAEKLAELLRKNGFSAEFYHGGLPNAERTIRQEEWSSGRTRVMVATNAFGMGIDKADVRFVAHYTMPDSIEQYYQEAGRAGRDGHRSYALLLVAPDDLRRITTTIESLYPPISEIKSIYEKICSYLQVAIGDGQFASFVFNIHDFCAREHIYIDKVRNALKILSMNGYMTLTEEFENPARLMFTVRRDDLYKIRIEREDLNHFITTLLRMYNGVFTEFRAISEMEIATVSGYTVERVKELLKQLWRMHIIKYVPSNISPMIIFDEERLPAANIYIASETYGTRKDMAEERLEQMGLYAENEKVCRNRIISKYFGEKNSEDCGNCDICIEKRRR